MLVKYVEVRLGDCSSSRRHGGAPPEPSYVRGGGGEACVQIFMTVGAPTLRDCPMYLGRHLCFNIIFVIFDIIFVIFGRHGSVPLAACEIVSNVV